LAPGENRRIKLKPSKISQPTDKRINIIGEDRSFCKLYEVRESTPIELHEISAMFSWLLERPK